MKNRYAFINSFSFSLIFKLFVLGIASFSLYLHIDIDDLPNTFRFFGYFTVLSNLFCFIILLLNIIKMIYNRISFSEKYNALKEYSHFFVLFKGMSLMSIILTFFIFHYMVANYKYPLLINNTLNLPIKDLFAHYLLPLFYVIDWLLFAPKGFQKLNAPFIWALYPFVYLIFTFVRLYQVPASSYFHLNEAPYFFLDINKLGYERVTIFSIIILFIILSIGYLIIGIEKIMCILQNRKL